MIFISQAEDFKCFTEKLEQWFTDVEKDQEMISHSTFAETGDLAFLKVVQQLDKQVLADPKLLQQLFATYDHNQ